MSDLLVWLFSVVVVGLAINLASAYVKPVLDERIDEIQQKRRQANRKKQEEFDAKVKSLLDNPMGLIHLHIEIQQRRTIQKIYLLLIFVLLSVVLIIAYGHFPDWSPEADSLWTKDPFGSFVITIVAAASLTQLVNMFMNLRSEREIVQLIYEYEKQKESPEEEYWLPTHY